MKNDKKIRAKNGTLQYFIKYIFDLLIVTFIYY